MKDIVKHKTSRLLFAAALFSAGLSACVNRVEIVSGDALRIEIGARVGSALPESKATGSGPVDYDTDRELPVSVVRWDEGGEAAPYLLEPVGATLGKPSADGRWMRKIDFEIPQFYLDRTKESGFQAWYPQESENWVTTADGKPIADDNTMSYNIDGQTDVLVSTFEKGSFATGIPALKFRHALCMYRIYAYAVDEETRDEWGDLTEVRLINLPEKLKVQFPADITAGQTEFSFENGASGARKEYWLLRGSDPAVELWPGFPPSGSGYLGTLIGGAPTDGIIGIVAKTTNQTTGNSVSIARNFKPGYAYNIYLKFSSKGIVNAEVSAGEWIYDGGNVFVDLDPDIRMFTDLSRYGTANSYVVSSANIGYCFDGTVKGNGVNILRRSDGTLIELPDREVKLEVAEVRIIRSDAMMKLVDGTMTYIEDFKERVETPLIELVSNRLSEGKVLFRVPGNKDNPDDYSLQYRGNVKIGAYDKAGKLVWSWHIWVTDKPYNQGYANGYTAMDRNLGAVMTDWSAFRPARSHWSGLYYQWGRKDPVFRPTVDEQPGWSSFWPRYVRAAAPLAEIHADPTAYYWTEGDAAWTTDTENFDHFWGYVGPWDEYAKTLYDPCPPGYRVPEHYAWQASSMQTDITMVSNKEGVFAGYRFSIGGGMIDVYYPGTACLAQAALQTSDRKSVRNAQNESYLYTATPYGDEAAYHFSYADGRDFASVLIYDPTLYHTERTAAYPVRCILESSSPIVENLSKSQTANSYVVSKTGFYKFRANVRGNGVTGLNVFQDGNSFYRSFDAGMGAAITGIDRVDILWWQGDLRPGSAWQTFVAGTPSSADIESRCPIRMIDNGKMNDDYAMFYAIVNEDTYGNVGLAAYDANGRILWTWHIWIQAGTFVTRLGNYTVMDRNLGATFVADAPDGLNQDNIMAAMGLYYQWGRKDPFFAPARPDETGSNTGTWYEKTATGWEWRTANKFRPKSTIQSSVEHPLEFFTSDNSFWQTTYTDYKGQANDLWGYVGGAGSIGESFAKTMYDPCPPGYKVMQHDVFRSANICEDNEEDTFVISQYANDYGLYLNSGMRTSLGAIQADGIWFPNAPAIERQGKFLGHQGVFRLSTATPYYSRQTLNTREMRWWKESSGGWWPSYEYNIRQDHGDNGMSAGRVVRCQME